MTNSKLHSKFIEKFIRGAKLKEAIEEIIGEANSVMTTKDIKERILTKYNVTLSRQYLIKTLKTKMGYRWKNLKYH